MKRDFHLMGHWTCDNFTLITLNEELTSEGLFYRGPDYDSIINSTSVFAPTWTRELLSEPTNKALGFTERSQPLPKGKISGLDGWRSGNPEKFWAAIGHHVGLMEIFEIIWEDLTLDFVTFVIFCIFVRHHLLMALRESMGGLPVREGARGREAFPRSNSTAVRCRLQLRRSQLRQHSWATTCFAVCWQQWGEPIYWQYRYVKLKREQTSSDNTNKKLNKNDEQHGNVTSRKGDWNIFSKEVTEILSRWMLDLVLPIKVSISPGKQFDVRWAIFWKLLLFTDAADSVSVLHNVFANQRRVCKSNTIVSKIPRVSWK